MNAKERGRLGDAFVALLAGDLPDAELLISQIRPDVFQDGHHKDAVRALLSLIEEGAAEHV